MPTVPHEESATDFVGNGATVDFPFLYPILEKTDLVITKLLDGETVAVLQVMGTDYTIDAAPSDAPTVHFLAAPEDLSTVHVERTVPITQEVDLLTQGPFSPKTLTRMCDKLTMIDQQLLRAIEALQALGSMVPVGSFEALVRQKTFLTDADAVEATFPITVALPAAFVPTGVWKVKIENLDDPAAIFYEAVDVPTWSAAALVLTVPYITGLAPGVNYRITLMMVQTEVT